MANTYYLLDTKSLTTSQSSITFSAIPQTYTDLQIIVSARSDQNGVVRAFKVQPNGTDIIAGRRLGDETGVYQDTTVSAYLPGTGVSSSNIFGGAEIWIHDYTNTGRGKPVFSHSVVENNASANGQSVIAGIYDSSTAVTSLSLAITLGNFVANSNFYLYGIKKS